MSNNANTDKAKKDALSKIETINAIDGFDPSAFVREFGDFNEGKKRKHLPVMAQMAWFRLKYPEGRIAVTVKPGKDYFIGEAKVFANYKDPSDCYLAEGSASRGYLKDNPTISPREWAQTAAIGIALRNAGFGLQFDVAGESFEDNDLDELSVANVRESSDDENTALQPISSNPVNSTNESSTKVEDDYDGPTEPAAPIASEPELPPLEKAKAAMCPIGKYKDKTLGEMICLDPKALAYVANSGKYNKEITGYAVLICEYAQQLASA